MKARFLTLDDMPNILRLQEKVVGALVEKSALQPLTVEEFTSVLSEKELMIGLFDNGKLIACRAMLVPEIGHEEHLGPDAGLSGEALSKVIHSEISMVDPDFRGQGLQTQMGKMLLEKIDRTRFRYILATVAPFNIPSIKDKLALGMNIIALKEKYSSKLRYIMYRDLEESNKESGLDGPFYGNKEVWVPMEDTKQQQTLLATGKKGTQIKALEGKWHVKFI